MKGQNLIFRKLLRFAALVVIFLFSDNALAFNNDVKTTSDRLHQNTEQLIKSLQSYLQANGRWVPAPGSQDMQACNMMSELQKQTNDLRARGANMNPNDLAYASNRLNGTLRDLGRQLKRIDANQIVLGNLRNVRTDSQQLSAISQAAFTGNFGNPGFNNNNFYGNPGLGNNNFGNPAFGNNPYGNSINTINPITGMPNNPYYNPPGFNPNAVNLDKNAIGSTADRLDRNVQQLVVGLQGFLTANGRWMPPAGSNDMIACQALHELQKQTHSLKSRARGMNVNDLSASSGQLRQSARGLADQLRRIGADANVINLMNMVSNDIRQLENHTGGGGFYNNQSNWGFGRRHRRNRDRDD